MATLTQAVDAVVNLTNTVDGKVQEIDNRIAAKENEVTQFLLNAPNSYMNKTFYVDAVNGDDANDGSFGAPFKTIKKAVDSVPTGGNGHILLFNNAPHDISDFISPANKTLLFESRNLDNSLTTSDEATYAEITLSSRDTGGYQGTYGFRIRNTFLHFFRIKITTPVLDTNTYPNGASIFSGLINRDDFSSGFVSFLVCSFNINDFPVIRVASGSHIAPIVKSYSAIFRKNSTAPFLYLEAGSAVIDISGTREKVDNTGAAITYNDLISGIVTDANGVPRNIVSNIVL